MSWGEVYKINSNLNLSLNEQMRQLAFSGAYLFTQSASFKPDKSGYYKVIVVGGGAEYKYNYLGGSGGVGISTLQLDKSASYQIEIDTKGNAVFNSLITATKGKSKGSTSSSVASGGTSSGADFNYSGLNGEYCSDTKGSVYNGTDVGVFVPELSRCSTNTVCFDGEAYTVNSGNGILTYGASGGYVYASSSDIYEQPPGGACVLIIPLELNA